MATPVAPMSFARQPLDLILAATGNVRVLRVLIGEGGYLSIAALAAATRITPGGVRKVVAALEALGMVEAIGTGRTRLFRVPPAHVLVAALAALFAVERERLDRLLAILAAAVSGPAFEAAWTFGGVARQDDAARRDVDLAVVVRPGPRATETVLDELGTELRERAGPLGYDLSIVVLSPTEARAQADARTALWRSLLDEGVALKGPGPIDFDRALRAAPDRAPPPTAARE